MRTFKLRMANDGKPLGFEFGSMFYYKDRKAAKPSTPAIKVNPYALPTKWLGRYELRPVQNDWHVGRITGGYGNSFKWTNRAGVSWKLKLNSHRQIMETGSDNPYHDHSYGGDEIRDFKLKVGPNGQPIGFQFGPMNFYRVGD